jgi:hypothetical protein
MILVKQLLAGNVVSNVAVNVVSPCWVSSPMMNVDNIFIL